MCGYLCAAKVLLKDFAPHAQLRKEHQKENITECVHSTIKQERIAALIWFVRIRLKAMNSGQTAYLDETNKLGGRLPSSGATAEQVKLASLWGLGRGPAMTERLNVQRLVVSNGHQ